MRFKVFVRPLVIQLLVVLLNISVNITYNDTNTSERIYILRNGTLSQWISNSNSNISIGCIDSQYLNSDKQLYDF